ncbi:Phosphonoacetaldehyde hydrolase [Kluyvera cryocrescens]|uniref:Phosphonoacetaldehyde hydrolase n=1 Tax=Kluyvera cryocrescens TaxID=580 RepID=A0A485B0A9_KLUCR|nr:Phosphonoacetaldehyde hydrolase [Kluyvera cryocrescens]
MLGCGAWGLALSGNEFGATWEEFQAMTAEEIATRREHRSRETLRRRGALCGGFAGGFTGRDCGD